MRLINGFQNSGGIGFASTLLYIVEFHLLKTVMVLSNQQWVVTRSTDPIDDSETISASLDASEGVQNGKLISLLIQYHVQARELKAYINWHEFFWSEGNQKVTYRFPPEAAQTEQWLVSRDFRDDDGDLVYGILTVTEPILFVNNLFKKERLIVRLKPRDNQAPITAVFNLPSQPVQLHQIISG